MNTGKQSMSPREIIYNHLTKMPANKYFVLSRHGVAVEAQRALDASGYVFMPLDEAQVIRHEMSKEVAKSTEAEKTQEEQNNPTSCLDCKLPYTDDGFQDLVVPHDIWKRIAREDGILCPTCLCRRAVRLNLSCPAEFRSGPFAPDQLEKDSET